MADIHSNGPFLSFFTSTPHLGEAGRWIFLIPVRRGWGFLFLVFTAIFLCSCNKRETTKETFTIETINKITPVKDQGRSSLCWVYAMLATIESDRLMQGDSVNLSAAYVARCVLMEQAERHYLTRGTGGVSLRGVAPMAVSAIMAYGLVPYDSYRPECNFNVAGRRIKALADNAITGRSGLERLRSSASDMLDEAVAPLPKRVYMLGAEYTPQEFARSVCREDEYVALTSYIHKPFFEDVVLDLPDNRRNCSFFNIPIDSLMSCIVAALRSGRSVCWEGDTSEPGFSFARGVARLRNDGIAATQEQRQRSFETFRTTDDHCMEIIGIARDSHGRRYFVCKNSWGTANPYGGLMFMSFNYARLKTVAVVMKESPSPTLPREGER